MVKEDDLKKTHRPIFTIRWVYCPMPVKPLIGLTGIATNEKKDFDDCTKCKYYDGIYLAEGAVICTFKMIEELLNVR